MRGIYVSDSQSHMWAESGRYLTWPHFGLLEKDEKTATSPANSSIKSRRGAANFDSTQHNGYQISRPRRKGRSAPRDCVACSLSAPEPPEEGLSSHRRNAISPLLSGFRKRNLAWLCKASFYRVFTFQRVSPTGAQCALSSSPSGALQAPASAD